MMDGMMTDAEALARVAKMRTEGEFVDFGNAALDVQLDGRFDMNDIEALYVLLHSLDFHGEQPPPAGERQP
jgi:hypothetical protein